MNYELRIGRGWSFRQDYKIGGWVESSAGLSGLTTSDFFGILPQETQKGEMIKLGTQEEGMEVKVKFPHAKTRRREEDENGEWGQSSQ